MYTNLLCSSCCVFLTDLRKQEETGQLIQPVVFVFLVLVSVLLYFAVSLMDPGFILSDNSNLQVKCQLSGEWYPSDIIHFVIFLCLFGKHRCYLLIYLRKSCFKEYINVYFPSMTVCQNPSLIVTLNIQHPKMSRYGHFW